MANAVEFIIKARDEASAAIQRVSGATTDLRGALTNLVTGGGVFGIIAAGAVAATGAMVALGAAAADTVEQLDRTSGRTGVTIEKLQALEEVTRQGGGSFDSVVTALTFLNRSIATNDPLLAQLGVTTRDTYSAFKQLADILSRSPDAAKRTEVAFKLMGRGAGEIIGQLRELANASDDMEKSLRESGALFTGEAAEGARKLDGQLDKLGEQWRSLVKSFQIFAVPVASLIVGMFDGMFKAAVGFARAMREHVLGPLEELGKVAKERETFEEKLANAKKEAKKVGGSVQVGVPTIGGIEVTAAKPVDPLAKLDLSEGGNKADSRKRRLEELQRVLNTSRADAEKFLKVLEQVETLKKKEKAVEDLRAAGVTNEQLFKAGAITFGEQFPVEKRDTRPKFELPPLAKVDTSAVDELLAKVKLVPEAFTDAGIAWGETVQSITSSTGIVLDGLNGLWNGLQNGFGTVFANLTNKTQTLRSAMKTIFSSLVSEVLALLARIVAAKVFGFILKFIPGIGTAAGFALDLGAGKLVGGGSSRAVGTSTGGNINVTIQAMDRSDIYRSLTSPRGELRAAFIEAAATRAY